MKSFRFPWLVRAVAAVLALFILLPGTSHAEELIRSFDSRIEIAANGDLTVTETIAVHAEGNSIRRGIYRDFPLVFEDPGGREREVGFTLLSVTRDGEPDNYRIERGNRSLRIYIGKPDYFLSPGDYKYQIKYLTDRQIRYFDDHDELYWNVTGNFWSFPIQKATAQVILPEGAAATNVIAYTGSYGSKDQNATAQLTNNGHEARFTTTRPLGSREGLTIAVSMPKGVIEPPSEVQAANWWLRDNMAELISALAFIGISLFYFLNWLRVGRDPPAGVIVPRWDPPGGISPALTNYIDKKGLSGWGWDAISAAILNLAVNGYVKLDELGEHVRIKRTGKRAPSPLPVGEAAILRQIDLAGGDFEVTKDNGSKVKKLQDSFSSAMDSEHRLKFYQHHWFITAAGVAMSVAGLIALLFFGNLPPDVAGITFFMAMGGGFVTIAIVRLVKAFTAGGNFRSRLSAIIFTAVIAYMAVSIPIPIIFSSLGHITRPIVISSVIGLIMLNVLFFYLIGAPTPLGRKMMDGIEGLKTYIRLAEADRMNLVGAPDMSPEHYETLLPYAVALGLEKPWSDAFEKWLAAAVAAGAVAATWQPSWYSGHSFRPETMSRTMSGISDSIRSSLTESMPAPKSSSSGFSGGGGSSGGGGGGGGGGGW